MEPLLLAGAAVGLAWGAVIFLRGGLLAGAVTVLLCGSVFGSPFFSVPMPPIPLTSDRLLLGLLVAQYLVWWRYGWTNGKPIGKADIAALVFLAVLVVSTLTHDWQSNNSMPLSRLLFFYFLPAVFYWVARQIVQTERSAYAMFGALTVFGLYLALTAVAETRELTSLVFPSYISSPEHAEFLGRGRGPFLNPAACGMFQGICLCAAVMWWPRLSRAGRVGLIVCCLAILFGIYSTYTRSAWMGGAFALMVTIAVQMPRSWRLPVIGGAVLAGSVVVATQWQNITAFKRDKAVSTQEMEESALLRPLLARVAWNMFVEHPFTGVGFGQYLRNNIDFSHDPAVDLPLMKARPYVQHNVWLGLIAETGLLGVCSFTVLVILWLRNAWCVWATKTAPLWARQQSLLFIAGFASYFPNAMFHDMAIIPMVNMVLFLLAGLSEGLAYRVLSGRLAADPRLAPTSARSLTAASDPRYDTYRPAAVDC